MKWNRSVYIFILTGMRPSDGHLKNLNEKTEAVKFIENEHNEIENRNFLNKHYKIIISVIVISVIRFFVIIGAVFTSF